MLDDVEPKHIVITFGLWLVCALVIWKMSFTMDISIAKKIIMSLVMLPIIFLIVKSMTD